MNEKRLQTEAHHLYDMHLSPSSDAACFTLAAWLTILCPMGQRKGFGQWQGVQPPYAEGQLHLPPSPSYAADTLMTHMRNHPALTCCHGAQNESFGTRCRGAPMANEVQCRHECACPVFHLIYTRWCNMPHGSPQLHAMVQPALPLTWIEHDATTLMDMDVGRHLDGAQAQSPCSHPLLNAAACPAPHLN